MALYPTREGREFKLEYARGDETSNPKITQQPDNLLKGIRNPIPQKPDNPLKGF